MRTSFRASPEGFWAKVRKGAECWEWMGSVKNGYGFYGGNRRKPAHVYAFELLVGPVPDGLVLDHTCRNRRCVNPAHLEPVTDKENILRGFGAPAINARKTTCKEGHPLSETDSRGQRYCRICRNAARMRRYYQKM